MPKESNSERTVKCPVEGCNAEKLSRGMHLHVRQSKGDGHGPQGEVPDSLDFEDLETVGTQEVSMDYPETRQTEQVGRLCPYCEKVFQGKQGVMIHLGRVAGDGFHAEEPRESHDVDDFDIVHVDESGSVIERVEEDIEMPSTERRRQREKNDESDLRERVRGYISDLRKRGKHEEAERAEERLLR
jgi:hypothetical protein